MYELDKKDQERVSNMWRAFKNVLTAEEYVRLKKECMRVFDLTKDIEDLNGFAGELKIISRAAKYLNLYDKLYSIMGKYIS